MSVIRINLIVILFLLLYSMNALAQTLVSIDSVDGLRNDSTLEAGQPHVITIRFNASALVPGQNYQPANAWILYSPDGANWGSVQTSVKPAFSSLGFDNTFNSVFNKTGGTGNWGLPQTSGIGNSSGIDTVGVLLAGVNSSIGNGMTSAFNDIVYTITFNSDPVDQGRHICLDTSGQLPGGTWEWGNSNGLIIPDWSGATCWRVSCCIGLVGNANGLGGEEPSVADIATIVDFLFGSGLTLTCLEEADVNLSGTTDSPPLDPTDISVADITDIVDYLFGSGLPLANCP